MLYFDPNTGMYHPTESGIELISSDTNVHEYPWMTGPLKHLMDSGYRFSTWTPEFPETANWVELFDPDFQAHITKTSGHCVVSLEHGGLTALVIEDRAAYFDITRVLGNTLSFHDKIYETITMLYQLEGNRVATTSRFITPLTGDVPHALINLEGNPESERPDFPVVTVCGLGEWCVLPGLWDGTVFENDEPIKTINYEYLISSLNHVGCPELVLDVMPFGQDTTELDGIELYFRCELQEF